MRIELPNEEDMYACLSPYILSQLDANSRDWKKVKAKLIQKWLFIFIVNKLRKIYQKSQKTVTNVMADYTNVWLGEQYPGSNDVEKSTHFLNWGDQVYHVRGWGEKRMHLLVLSKLIQDLKPKKYLEVGCGNGAMLMMIAVMHPEVEFYGLELTDGGYSEALKMQNFDQIPENLLKFLPGKPRDLGAHKNIKFIQGNAADLPFKDQEFDFVVTSLALEQMREVQFSALRQLRRVSNKFIVMIEPFTDFNRAALRRLFTKSRDYFSCSISDLSKFSINSIVMSRELPAKVTRGVGVVIAMVEKNCDERK